MTLSLSAIPISQAEYSKYGDLIEVRADSQSVKANLGTATRFNWLSELKNLRNENAKPNLCLFKCEPMIKKNAVHFDAQILEKHPYSSQVFIPMSGVDKFLVLVALGADKPDLKTAAVFVANSSQGITYHPGVWHHPLIALDPGGCFTCIVWEDKSEKDCVIERLFEPIRIVL